MSSALEGLQVAVLIHMMYTYLVVNFGDSEKTLTIIWYALLYINLLCADYIHRSACVRPISSICIYSHHAYHFP